MHTNKIVLQRVPDSSLLLLPLLGSETPIATEPQVQNNQRFITPDVYNNFKTDKQRILHLAKIRFNPLTELILLYTSSLSCSECGIAGLTQ